MELLPCPFCGGEALPTAHLTYNWFAPVCRRCNARGPSVKIERDSDPQEMRNLMNQADENWNRRASPASAPEGWKHSCNALCLDGVELWIPQCPHCGKPAPTPPVSEDRWQPIETAPKDGSKFLAWRRHSTIPLIVFYNAEYDHYECNDGNLVFSLTHWRPLPKAPTMQEDKP